jgi:hypothetical protein
VVTGEVLEVGVEQPIARCDDERGAELQGPPARLLLALATHDRADRSSVCTRFEEGTHAKGGGSRDAGRLTFAVQQNPKRDPLIRDERIGVSPPTGANCGDAGPQLLELAISVSDLTGPFTTGESTKVAQKQHDVWRRRPQISQSLRVGLRILQSHVGEC